MHSGGLIVDRPAAAGPVAALPSEEFANKDSELLACDVECRLAGVEGFYLELDIPGLDELVGQKLAVGSLKGTKAMEVFMAERKREREP
jgi:hypothetical protein